MIKKLVTCLVVLAVFSTPLFAQWSNDPAMNTAVCDLSGEQAIPKVVSSADFTYVSWFSSDAGNYDVRLQLYDSQGNEQWEHNGILISNHEAMTWLTDWDMTIDNENHAILAFQDIRTGSNNIYAYRISPNGDFVWGADGIALSNTSSFDASPVTAVTSSGNAIIAWTSETVSFLQKISPAGDLLWGDTGITLTGTESYSWPQIIPIENDNILVKFYKDTGSYPYITRNVYAQRFDADGNPVWSEDTIISNAGGVSAWTQILSIVKDHDNGFYVAWRDDRDNNMILEVYLQHIDSDGNCTYEDNGMKVSTLPNRNRMYVQLALPPNSDNIFAFWNEMDSNQINRGIYGQKISPSGERLWGDSAIAFIELSSTNVLPFAAGASQNDAVLFYEYLLSAINTHIKAMRIDEDGNYVWPDEKVMMCSANSQKIHPDVSCFQNDQWVATWEDNRNGANDIYAQNINLDGTLGTNQGIYEKPDMPDFFFLANSPNPFNYQTEIQFSLNTITRLEISIYNIKGEKVKTLVKAEFNKGLHSKTWNGKDDKNQTVSSGIYFVKMKEFENNAISQVEKIMFIK